MKNIVALLSLILLCSLGISQDQILTMSGRQIDCKIVDIEGFEVVYDVVNKHNKTLRASLHKSELFSSTRADEAEFVYYTQDVELGDWLSEEEMRIYIAGQCDARASYKTQTTFALGLGAARFLAFAASGGLILSVAFPIVYTVIQLLPYIKIKEETISDLDNQYNEVYALGYERVARSRKVMSALAGSAMGMFGGILYYFLAPFEK
ncbi:MAG: hypothetical protein ACI84C_000483 [Flavobacteriales bacterium]|jgi:hypothetical protein